MKILLIILLSIASIIACLLILALFIKKHYSITRETVIKQPVKKVFDYIKLLKNQDHYNKWWTADPAAKKEFTGTDGTVGFITAWDSKDKRVGKGAQEITAIREGERIDFIIRFYKPFEGVADVYMSTEPLPENQTRVKWGFSGANKYPMNLMNLFTDKLLGSDLQASIDNLKKELEKK
ncbi:MAG: SRPBCC family protein [Cytophagaceae bacterium]